MGTRRLVLHALALSVASTAALVPVAAAARAQARDPAPVKPVSVRAPTEGNGHTETWDGRVFLLARFIRTRGRFGWGVMVLRPERVTRDGRGAPDFTRGAFSDDAVLELEGDPGTGMGSHNAFAVVPAPGFAENPFRSDRDGRPNPGGGFETYEMVLFTQWYESPDGAHHGLRRARVVVRDPRTGDAAIERAEMLSPFEPLRATDGSLLRGIEPTLTFDGRLLFWHDGDKLRYSFNPAGPVAAGWSPSRPIADMYHVDRDTPVAGIPFRERFPIAAEPLRDATGVAYGRGEQIRGAYPWISHDGTELFYQATAHNDGATRASTSVIGRLTGYAARHVDGPANPDRRTFSRLFISSPGLAPGFWTPHRDAPGDPPLPYTASRPVYPIFGSNSADYYEVGLDDFADRDHVLVHRMNELVTRGERAELDAARTPDTSGNFNTGELRGARFPQEVFGDDRNRGAVGQSIYFGEDDSVRVRPSASLNQTESALTVQLFVRRTVNLDQDGENRYRVILNRPGAYDLILEESGHVHATVHAGGDARRSGFVGPPIPLNEWTSVAFTYDAATGRLRTYVGGRLGSDRTFGPAPIDRVNGELIIGPAGQIPRAPFVPGNEPIVAIDELKISRVVRSPEEIARDAFLDVRPAAGSAQVPLPRGLDPADLRIPPNDPPRPEAVELGRMLFFDPRLSADRQVSCATCHDPARVFTDGRPIARGIFGRAGRRNTTTVVNRALSTVQFWDGRAASLEAQALQPLQNTTEMGSDLADVVRFLGAVPEYRDRFGRAFGAGPSEATIGRAYAAFQRTLLSGDSRVDRFEAGDRGALDDAERRGRLLFRGKARCTACHTGSNFTDERFHNTAAGRGGDPGREGVTGRRHDRGAFKTPTLRDLPATAPYFHDGSAATIEEVIDVYDRGGLRVLDRDVEIRPLGLTAGERSDLAAFLRALAGSPPQVAAPPLPPDPPGVPRPNPNPNPTPSPNPQPNPSPRPNPNPNPAPAPGPATGTGLKGEYSGRARVFIFFWASRRFTRTDAAIDFDFGGGGPGGSLNGDRFSVRWTGQVEAPTSEDYTFTTLSDDGVRVYVDGRLIIDNYTVHAAVENSGTIRLDAGRRHDIRVEYFEQSGGAVIKLFWQTPSRGRTIVPRERLYPAR